MKKHTTRVSPLTACDSPVLSLTWLEGGERTADAPGRKSAAEEPKGALDVLGRVARGTALAVCLAGCWAGVTQLGKAVQVNFEAPFFVACHAAGWNLLLFPAYCASRLLVSWHCRAPLEQLRASTRLLSEGGFSVRVLVTRTGPFCVLWMVTTYLYLLALRNISTTEVSALFCCNKAFVFLLSWIVLKDRFMGVRIVAAILSVTGIVLIAYADGFLRNAIVGVALVVGSASASALYKVLFKLLLGPARFGEVMFFLTALGAFSLLFLSWVSVALHITRVEPWPSAGLVPWGQLCGLAALLLVFNVLINCGAAVTSPTLVSLGVFLSVPVNTATDVYQGTDWGLGQVRLSALFILCLAFLLLLLPEEWDTVALGVLTKLGGRGAKEDPDPDNSEGSSQAAGWPSSLPGPRCPERGDVPTP
ncbi:putative thiamine transporter SLC35F3 [Pristis pectinata]|uniref:putative thiamine transporter SLC35F3 n=1 Tax=Pristis pectinata TaxID=685728 RepID=UPI00223D0CBE|nr:putative thiamine transporter SLC35F3 [Pristis pectinata]